MRDAFDEPLSENAPDPAPDPWSETETQPTGRFESLRKQPILLFIALAAAIGGLALIVLFAILLLRDDETTAEITPIAPESDLRAETFAYQSISDSGTISVTLETPLFLSIAGEDYSVEAELLTDEAVWSPIPLNETSAVWAYGTIINYIFALQDSDLNRALLEALEVGDAIVVASNSGPDVSFTVSSRERVQAGESEILAQRAPGVTLILLEDSDDGQRLIVQGRYVVPDAIEGGATGVVVELGATAQLEDLQFTVDGVSQLFDRPEAPAGFSFFLVDYQVQNVGSTIVDPRQLSMVLTDDLGNRYALSPDAAALGNHPLLNQPVGPGQSIQATAGYLLPIGLASPSLRWRVSMGESGAQIEVSIPFRQAGATDEALSVTLQSADVSLDGTNLQLTGQIVNLGDQPAIVAVDDVVLGSNGTVFLMLSTSPAFPWVINPGGTLSYGFTFQRPASASATFSILDHAFQLNGLR